MLKHKLIVTPQAVTDIQEAVDYYNSKQKGLGRRFYNELQEEFKAIKQNPEYRSIRYGNIRLAHLDKFPYAAHFEFNDAQVIVNAVLSDYQNLKTRL